MMDKLIFYRVSALGMLLLNLGLLTFIVLAPRGGGPGQMPVKGRLQLDDAQHDAFLNLADAHGGTMRGLSDRQRDLLVGYFDQLEDSSIKDSPPLPGEVLELEEQKIKRTYEHLLSVRQLLRPEQAEYYPEFMRGAMSRILIQKKQPLPRRDGKRK